VAADDVPMTNYYHHIRREIGPLLPERATQILEVGSGAGGTLKWLKTIYPEAETTGVELNSDLSEQLKRNADIAIIGSIEEGLAKLKSYDLVLLLDVLEHLVDSTNMLRNIVQRLNTGGKVIVSVPNVAHLGVSLPLLLQRRFIYQNSGILDRTHVKFFVEDTAVRLLNEANLNVTMGLVSGLQGPKSKVLNRLTFGLLKHHLTRQYIMRGERSDAAFVQRRVRWMIAK
jgi:2-polyprenyl-3-methyl-5-hydroxy-6-metoxy-1,4-benzoquinol methylase